MRQYLIFLEVLWNLRSTTYFLTRAREAPVSWLEFVCKCCHFFGFVQTRFCIAFLCPFNFVRLRNEYDTPVKRFWILPGEIHLNVPLHVKSGSTW